MVFILYGKSPQLPWIFRLTKRKIKGIILNRDSVDLVLIVDLDAVKDIWDINDVTAIE